MTNYKEIFVEVHEVLNHLSKEDLKKIPYVIRKKIIDDRDLNYIWTYDETKKLNEQNLKRETIILLSYLNMEYLMNKEQKELMEQLHKLNETKLEDIKLGAEDLFNKNETKELSNNFSENEGKNKLIESPKKSVLNEFFSIVKKILFKLK